MKVGNADFLRSFNFSSEASSNPGRGWRDGARMLYVRCFILTVQQLNDIIDDWEESSYFPQEAKIWADECRNEVDEKLLYIRYVGQCSFPRTPKDRFDQDVTARFNKTFFTRFTDTLSRLYPEVLEAARVFGLREPLPPNVTAQMVDDYERMLICILGYQQLLNRQLGGYWQSYKLTDSHNNLFKSLQTNIYSRWNDYNSSLPADNSMITHLITLLSDIRKWMNENQSIVYKLSEEYEDKLVKEQTPYLYRGVVLAALFADDVTLADFKLQRDYLGRFPQTETQEGTTARSSAVVIENISHLLKLELTNSSAFDKDLLFKMFPFKNFFPWVGKRFETTARKFSLRYLELVRPLLVIGIGSRCSRALAANLLHDNGFHSKKFIPFVGIPKLCAYVGGKWIVGNDLDLPEDNLFLLLPHIDPGISKHYADSTQINCLSYLCWMVTFVHISLTMSMLDENIISPAQNRKEFLNELVRRASQLMEKEGLSGQLEASRRDLSKMFEKRAQEQSPRAPVGDITRERNSWATMRSIAKAGVAIGTAGSPEREKQLLKLWKFNFGRLHTIIPHDEAQKPAWLSLMNEVAIGRIYATSLMNKKQAQDAAAAGANPLAHILRPLKPETVSEEGDDWMWNDDIVQPVLKEKGISMWQSREKNLPDDYYSSELQRDRASGPDTIWQEIIHNVPVIIRPDGRFYIYYKDPVTNARYTYPMWHRAAYSSEGAERRLVVTETGLAIVNERGDYILPAKGTTNNFMDKSILANRKNGLILKQAWELARHAVSIVATGDAGPSQTARTVVAAVDTDVDAVAPVVPVPVPIDAGAGAAVESGTALDSSDASNVVEAGPSQTAVIIDETGQGYESDTTVFSLTVNLYNGNEAIASTNLAASGQNPSSTKYNLPVHISDPVVPFKRFLDDLYPLGGQIFLVNPTLGLPLDYQKYSIWSSLLRHLDLKSRNHPYYSYWRSMAEGAGNLTPLTKHLAKLRQISSREKKNVDVVDATGMPKRTKGTLLKFEGPLPNAGKRDYRL